MVTLTVVRVARPVTLAAIAAPRWIAEDRRDAFGELGALGYTRVRRQTMIDDAATVAATGRTP